MSKQVEGFCHMKYRAKDGSEVSIWNSRNAVTPFIVHIERKEYQHVDWRADRYDPDYKPRVGEYIFENLNIEKATKSAREHVEKYWDNADMPMSQHPFFGEMSKEQAIEHFAKDWVGDGNQPTLTKVGELLIA